MIGRTSGQGHRIRIKLSGPTSIWRCGDLGSVGRVKAVVDHCRNYQATRFKLKTGVVLIRSHSDETDSCRSNRIRSIDGPVDCLIPLLSKLGFQQNSASTWGIIRLVKRKPLESRTIRSVGYVARRQILEIEFQSGAVYQYLDVPQKVHEELIGAKSKGQYFNREIRDDYEFVREGKTRRAAGG